MDKKILGVIVARGGSKRLPGKNIRNLSGKPLIAWTIDSALQSKSFTRLIVSTDSENIASVAKRYGGDVPFIRPSQLATDASGPIEVLQHALLCLETHTLKYDIVVLLQATSPFRTTKQIDDAIKLYLSSNADTLTSLCVVKENAYYQVSLLNDGSIIPVIPNGHLLSRKELPSLLIENGAIYILSATDIRNGNFYGEKTVGYPMDNYSSIDIDTMEDFFWAEYCLTRKEGHFCE